MEDEREVSTAEALQFAKDNELMLLETSAKEDNGITEAFETIVRGIEISLSLPSNIVNRNVQNPDKARRRGSNHITNKYNSYYCKFSIKEKFLLLTSQ